MALIGPWYDTEKFQTSPTQRKWEVFLLDDDDLYMIEIKWFYWYFISWRWWRSWYLAFSSESVSESNQIWYCKVMSRIRKSWDKDKEIKPLFYVLDFYDVLFVWKDGSVIRWSKWSEKLIPKQINLGNPTDPANE